jgi:hypothetical protein
MSTKQTLFHDIDGVIGAGVLGELRWIGRLRHDIGTVRKTRA